MNYRQVKRTVTLTELLEIVAQWTREGADLVTLDRDATGNPTRAVLVDHGQHIHAEYTVGPVSDEPEPYITPAERERRETIHKAHALAEKIADIHIRTVQEPDGRNHCWEVWIPSLNWRPALPYGYCYTAHQLLMTVEEAVAVYSRAVGIDLTVDTPSN